MFSVTPWTEENTNIWQTPQDSLKTRRGTSPKCETDFTATGRTEGQLATKGHHDALGRNVVEENGYGPSPEKQRLAMIDRDLRHCQYEHTIQPERPKTFEAPLAVDFVPKGSGTRTESDMRHYETWKIKDPGPQEQKDCSKTGNSQSEVVKIVPLKPQRSKKSLNKENKDINPQTQSQTDRGIVDVDVHMTKSKDRSSEAGRKVHDNTVLPSATDIVRENKGLSKYQREDAMFYQQQTQQVHKEFFGQQELRDFRGTTGQSQCTRGGSLHEEHFQNNSEFKEVLFSSSKPPTAPPRTLPLKTHWSWDRQSNTDTSHIHYRPPSQETSKRKQAVNHLPALFVHHRKVEHCKTLHELRTMSCKSCFNHLKNPKQSRILQNSCGCVSESKSSRSFTLHHWPRELFAFRCSRPQSLTSAWPFQNTPGL